VSVCVSRGSNTLYQDDIFDNNTVVVEVLTQLSVSAQPDSEHNVLITVDYGMDGIDYISNVTINATADDASGFSAVCRHTLHNKMLSDLLLFVKLPALS